MAAQAGLPKSPRRTGSTIGLRVALFICGAPIWVSCASDYQGSWMGHPLSQLVATWGDPDSSTRLNDGRTVYSWTTTWSDRYGVNTCRRTFTVGTDERVEKWSFTNCPRW